MNDEILKAELPPRPNHPRALVTLLEGLAMWAGEPITAAIFAGRQLTLHYDEALFGDPLLPVDSALVHFDLLGPPGRRRTLAGVGDFRQLRLAQRRAR
ncbi:MAG: hypothetical protein H6826_15440 [Planctomycetes bacterium]|nr:hypothetical protein [Myxococcales bacterium]MCB9902735.1 hypothetical protein [Planctomycetota bacterium]